MYFEAARAQPDGAGCGRQGSGGHGGLNKKIIQSEEWTGWYFSVGANEDAKQKEVCHRLTCSKRPQNKGRQ